MAPPADQRMHAQPARRILLDKGLAHFLPVGLSVALRAAHGRPEIFHAEQWCLAHGILPPRCGGGQGGGFRLDNGAMKLLGFQIPNYTFPGVTNDKLFDHVVMLASAAEKAGFDSVGVMDHFYQLPNIGPRTEPMLEGYATLAGIAARTKRVRLGTLVTGVTYRNPAFLAKEVATLDVVSSGRAILGLGAAWNEEEHCGYGYDLAAGREKSRP